MLKGSILNNDLKKRFSFWFREGGLYTAYLLYVDDVRNIGFGGLGVACWPLVPKFAGSNPAEAVGFLGRKNSQHAFFRRGSKAVGPMSQIYGM